MREESNYRGSGAVGSIREVGRKLMKDNKRNRDELQSSGQESSDETEDRDWSEVPNDPDPAALGYEREEWERITVSESDQVVFLPGNEEDVEDDAFVVSDVSALCDLSTRR